MQTFSLNSSDSAFRPAGFKEIREMFDWADECVMRYGDIKNYMSEVHMFSDGQIAGLVQRACRKGLLKQIDRGTYAYNDRYPEEFPDDRIGDIGMVNWDISRKVKTLLHNALSAAMRISVSNVAVDDISSYQSVIDGIGKFVEGEKVDLVSLPYSGLPLVLRKRLSECLAAAEQKTRNIVTLFDAASASILGIYSGLSIFVLYEDDDRQQGISKQKG